MALGFRSLASAPLAGYISAGTAYTLTAAKATFTETGNAVNLLKGNVVLTVTDSFTETGNAANLTKQSKIVTAVGAFTETGNNTALTKQWKLVADVGAFVMIGVDASLLYSGNAHPPMTAGTGSYILTGNAANLIWKTVLSTVVGTYTETGNAATLRKGWAIVADNASYSETGNSNTLKKDSVLTTETTTFTFTGKNVRFLWSGAPGVAVEILKMSHAVDEGVSKISHNLTDTGGGTYTITTESTLSEDKTDSVHYEGYIIS